MPALEKYPTRMTTYGGETEEQMVSDIQDIVRRYVKKHHVSLAEAIRVAIRVTHDYLLRIDSAAELYPWIARYLDGQ